MKPELHAGGRIVGGEELFVAVGVDDDVGEQGSTGIGQTGAGVAGVEHLECDVLHAAAPRGHVAGDGRRGLRADQHERHAARRDGGHPHVGLGQWHLVEAEPPHQAGRRLTQVRHRDDDVIDAAGDRVESGRPCARGRLLGRRIGAMAGDLDAVRLGEQHAEQLLGEVGVDAGLDGLLSPRGDDVAYAVGLDDGCVGVLLHGGDLAAHGQPFGDDRDQRGIELIDARAEVGKVGCNRLSHRRARYPLSPTTTAVGAATRASGARRAAAPR